MTRFRSSLARRPRSVALTLAAITAAVWAAADSRLMGRRGGGAYRAAPAGEAGDVR